MRFHEELDRGFLLRLAPEDLGDDEFHLAAIALIEQPRAPGDDCVAPHDQRRQSADPPAHQLASLDRLAVRLAELGPGKHVRQHAPHRPRGIGAKRDAAKVEPVIGDRKPVPLRSLEQVLGGDAEVVKPEPVVVRVLERVKAIFDDLEMLVFVVGQVGDQDRGLVLDKADQADRPARNRIRDEELLAVDQEIVAGALGRGFSKPSGSEPAAGLGQGEARELLTASSSRAIRQAFARLLAKRGADPPRPIQP